MSPSSVAAREQAAEYSSSSELDEPAFTQPKMYRDIRKRRSVPEAYEAALEVSCAAFPRSRQRLIFSV